MLVLVYYEPFYVLQHRPNELRLLLPLLRLTCLVQLLQQRQIPQTHEVIVEVLVRKNVKNRVYGLTPPLLKLQLGDVCDQFFQD